MIQETIARVCAIPVAFRRDPDATIRRLLEESEYERFQDQVTPALLQQHLSLHPELVEAWIRYSEGKKVETGWYLEGLAVGYYVPGIGMGRKQRYPDPAQACAEFIKKEMEALMERAP